MMNYVIKSMVYLNFQFTTPSYNPYFMRVIFTTILLQWTTIHLVVQVLTKPGLKRWDTQKIVL